MAKKIKINLKNDPNYQQGHFWAKRLVPFIGNTRYGSLEEGIKSKKELVEDLKENFGWDETHKDVAEALGVISAWEKELKKKQ